MIGRKSVRRAPRAKGEWIKRARAIAAELDTCKHGEQGAVVERIAQESGRSVNTLRHELGAIRFIEDRERAGDLPFAEDMVALSHRVVYELSRVFLENEDTARRLASDVRNGRAQAGEVRASRTGLTERTIAAGASPAPPSSSSVASEPSLGAFAIDADRLRKVAEAMLPDRHVRPAERDELTELVDVIVEGAAKDDLHELVVARYDVDAFPSGLHRRVLLLALAGLARNIALVTGGLPPAIKDELTRSKFPNRMGSRRIFLCSDRAEVHDVFYELSLPKTASQSAA